MTEGNNMTNGRNDMGAIQKIASSFYGRGCCRTQADREDLFGEIALGWAEGLSRVDGSLSEREQTSFLFTYARGFGLNWIRSRVRHEGQEDVLTSEDASVGEIADAATIREGMEAFFRGLLLSRLWAAVEALPERERQVVVMRHQDGLTAQEVGEALGVSKQRVNQIEKAAYAKVAPIFEEAA